MKPDQVFEARLRNARRGDKEDQYTTASSYATGDGTATNLVEAVKWFRSAAQQGHPEAQLKLALACVEGKGVAKNVAEAAIWFQKAADQGHINAQLHLGLAYIEGTGCKRTSLKPPSGCADPPMLVSPRRRLFWG